MIDKLIKDNLNPYVVSKITLHGNGKSLNDIEVKLVEKFGLKQITKLSNKIISVNLNEFENIVYTDKTSLNGFLTMLDECNIEYTLTDMINIIWEMEDINSILPMEDPCPELTSQCVENYVEEREKAMEILKVIFSRSFGLDDALDRLSKVGMEKMNVFNLFILK